jgi:hypothetical protein
LPYSSICTRSAGGTVAASEVTTDSSSTRSCTARLCRVLVMSAGGAAPDPLKRKTAVPGTRVTSMSSRSAMKSWMGTSPRRMRSAINRRPVRHVVIIVMMMSATTIGNQPPSGIFATLAPKKPRSTTSSGTDTASTRPSGQSQRLCTKAPISTVVTAIVPVTAMPYAAARALELPKLSTSEIAPIISSQLMAGTYTCPAWVAEVWITATRGR